MTRAEYRAYIVSALRKKSMFWPVRRAVKIAARRPNESANKSLKWQYQCNLCKQWWRGDEVQVDHICELGDILEDPKKYLGNLFCEAEKLQVLCIGCHRAVTIARKNKRTKKST